jgi:sugar O-acyltransferase (sialic acid O-acetyltransferase NeuD family)
MYNKKICIAGAGGFAKEVLACLVDIYPNIINDQMVCFMVRDDEDTEPEIMGVKVIKESEFKPELYEVTIAIGDPHIRKKVVRALPKETVYANIIHPSANISKWVKIGNGCVICTGVIITCDITIGDHTQLNLYTTIGHDCVIGDFFTTAPSVTISGKCEIGNNVYFGTNSSVREKTTICDDVVIGMGAMVIKNINEPGVYIGNPIKKLEKKN